MTLIIHHTLIEQTVNARSTRTTAAAPGTTTTPQNPHQMYQNTHGAAASIATTTGRVTSNSVQSAG